MRQDSRAQFRKIRDDKMESSVRDAKKKIIINKAESCLDRVECFVQKEIEKGRTIEEAIKIIKENESIIKTYPQLKDDQVKAVVFNTIRGREKIRQKNKKEIDDMEM